MTSWLTLAHVPVGRLYGGSGTLIGVNTYVTAHHAVDEFVPGASRHGQSVLLVLGRALDLDSLMDTWRYHFAGLAYLEERMLELGLKPFGLVRRQDGSTLLLDPNTQDIFARYVAFRIWECRPEYWDTGDGIRDIVTVRCSVPIQVETLSGDMANIYPGDVWGWIPFQDDLLRRGDHIAVSSINMTNEVLESPARCDDPPAGFTSDEWQQYCPFQSLLHSPTGDVERFYSNRRRCSGSDSPARYEECFMSRVDTYGGSSGGGVISDDSLEIVGVVSGGIRCSTPEDCRRQPFTSRNRFTLPSNYFRSRYSNNDGPTEQPFQWYPTTARGYTPESPELVSGGLIGNPSDPADTVTHICPNAGEYVAGIVGHYAQAESKDDDDLSLVVGFGSIGIVCRPDNPTTRKGYGFHWSRVFMRGTRESTYDVVLDAGLRAIGHMPYMTFRNRIVSRDAVVGTPRARERHCPPGTIMRGLSGQGNGQVIGTLFDVQCQTLGSAATFTSVPDVLAPNNQYGSTTSTVCPLGAAIGIRYHLTSNQNVQGFELLCTPFDTPAIPL